MVGHVYAAVFCDLRKLAAWFAASPQRSSPAIERLLSRLGSLAVPLLGRELRTPDLRRRQAARDGLAIIAAKGAGPRARVTRELHAVSAAAVADDAKVVALGLLSELGERAEARFGDPVAIRMRSAIALATHLETDADLASAAGFMVTQLAPDEIVHMVEAMAEPAPGAARRLAAELALRLDVPEGARERIALLVATLAPRVARARRRRQRVEPTVAAVLVDAAARRVVIACRRSSSGRRWRRWAVLISATGHLEDSLHEEDAGPDGDAGALIAALGADGYRVASTDLAGCHDTVARAARRTAEATRALPSPYYLGRDLLALGDAHLGDRARHAPAAAALARALELLAAGDQPRALALLERCDSSNPDAAAAIATIALAQHRPADALAALDRALAAEPDWPLHHWNVAAALYQLGDPRGCYHALRRFVATSAMPTGLYGDPDQPARVGCAERMIAELERAARLTGRPLAATSC
jgi:hypothetical protein